MIPELGVHHQRIAAALRGMIAQAVAPAFGGDPPPALLGLLEAIFEYRTWQTLTKTQDLSDAAAADAIGDAACSLLSIYSGKRISP